MILLNEENDKVLQKRLLEMEQETVLHNNEQGKQNHNGRIQKKNKDIQRKSQGR